MIRRIKARGGRVRARWTLAAAVGCAALALPATAGAETGTSISVGFSHTCAVTAAGGVECWGSNEYGRLGDGTMTRSAVPVDVSGLQSGVTAVSAGYNHTCALTSAGGVECWGNNSHGQLGDGTMEESASPVPVSGLQSGVTAISAGASDTCALTSAGGVECWGSNGFGQLGDGTTEASATPVPVLGLQSGVAAVSAGAGLTCARTVAGAVECWGDNEYGQLGDGTTEDAATPVAVPGLQSGVTAVSAGYGHACAVTGAGGVECWGQNEFGELGDGTTTESSTPVAVSGLQGGVSAVSAGESDTCALTIIGVAECWGENEFGQLGDGGTTTSTTPIDVGELTNVSAIGAGGAHTCALYGAGVVACWGRNHFGELGDGMEEGQGSETPVDVHGLRNEPVVPIEPVEQGTAKRATVLSTGGEGDTCVVTGAGGVECWGYAAFGQLGDGQSEGESFSSDGAVTGLSTTPVDVSGLKSGVSSVSVGDRHTCAVTSAGGVECWGDNSEGELGDRSYDMSKTPVDVVGLQSGIAAVSAGGETTCALTGAGGVECWGNGRPSPSPVSGLQSGIVAVRTGFGFSCALTSAGGVECWGANEVGELGDGTTKYSATPVDVSGLQSGVVAISVGSPDACALTVTGAVECWGGNESGELGNGTMERSLTPVDVSGLQSGVSAIGAGQGENCAVTSAGAVKCWGHALLGDGTEEGSTVPVDVRGLQSGVVAVSVSYLGGCALTSTGAVKCWGRGILLGEGSLEVEYPSLRNSLTPVQVSGLTGEEPKEQPHGGKHRGHRHHGGGESGRGGGESGRGGCAGGHGQDGNRDRRPHGGDSPIRGWS